MAKSPGKKCENKNNQSETLETLIRKERDRKRERRIEKEIAEEKRNIFLIVIFFKY